MLAYERKKRKIRQIDLAKALGRGQSYVSRYEAGERRLYYFDVLEIANAIGFDAAIFTKHLMERAHFSKSKLF
jgi:transcriptional regulator with XRE-family HTH domain